MPVLHTYVLGEGPDLFILHGFMGMADNWMTLGRRFAEHFRVHLIDLRNHGRSFHHNVMNYDSMREDVLHYADERNIGNFTVLGHSMGGKLAMHIACRHPENVSKLIVVDIAPKSYPPRHIPLLEALQSVDFSRMKRRADIDAHLSKSITSPAIRLFLMKNLKRKKDGGFEYKFNLPVLIRSYGEINRPLPGEYRCKGDSLFIRGSLSPYISPDDETLIYRHFPKAVIRDIPGAGHWVHAEKPDLLYDMVRDFCL